MRVGLVPGVWSYGLGSLATVLAVHEAVRLAGHTPVLFASPHFRPVLERLGVPAVPIPGPARAHYPDEPGTVLRLDDLLSRSAYADRDLVETVLSAQLRAFRAHRVQALFHDYDVTTVLAGAFAGIPVVSPVTWPDHHLFGRGSAGWRPVDTRALDAFRVVLRRSRRPEPASLSEVLFDWSTRLVYPLAPEMDPIVARHTSGEYLGHLGFSGLDSRLDAGPAEWPRPGRVGLLAYTSGPPMDAGWYYDRCRRAFDGSDVDVLISAGGGGDGDGGGDGRQDGPRVSPAGNVQLWPLLPLRRLLGRATALLCHGGRNTLAGALHAGVPLIVFPGGDPEREYFADMLARQGLAANCGDDDWRPDRLRALIDEVRAGGPAARPASGRGAGRCGGAARVVSIMQELTADPVRLLSRAS